MLFFLGIGFPSRECPIRIRGLIFILPTIITAAAALVLLAAPAFAQAPVATIAPKLLPGTKAGLLSSIQGNAVNQANGSLVDTVVRLRDARYGRIVSSVTTNKQGLFSF